MKLNEDSRGKIPSILHLTRLGYQHISLKEAVWNEETNIFTDIFIQSIQKINYDLYQEEAIRLLNELSLLLDHKDLGKGFYDRLIQKTGHKIIDFDTFEINPFNVVTELIEKNGDEGFRTDILGLADALN